MFIKHTIVSATLLLTVSAEKGAEPKAPGPADVEGPVLDLTSLFQGLSMPALPPMPDLLSIFPEHMHEEVLKSHVAVQKPQGFDLSSLFEQLEPKMQMPSFLSDMGNFFSMPLSFMNGPPPPPMKIDVIRIIHRPDYVAHECFQDAMQFCDQPLEDDNQHATRMCMMDHLNQVSAECKTFLLSKPSLVESCYKPINKICPKAKYDCHSTMDCVADHRDEIAKDKENARCVSFIDQLESRHPISAADRARTKPEILKQAGKTNAVFSDETKKIKKNASRTYSSELNQEGTEDNSNHILWYAGIGGGLVAFAVVGAIVAVQRRKNKDLGREYSPIIADEEEYDEYA